MSMLEQYPVGFNEAVGSQNDALGSFANLAAVDALQQKLAADISSVTLARDEEITKLEAELSAAKAGWAGKIAIIGEQISDFRTIANTRIGAYIEYAASGIEDGTIAPEEVVYIRGLADGFVTRDSCNFPRAQEYLDRYKQLQPNERILVYSHFRDETTIYPHHIRGAGVLSDKPKPLPFKRSDLGFHNLELEFPYPDGRVSQHQVRHILDDSAGFERAAVTGTEVNKVVTAWSEFHIKQHALRMKKDGEGMHFSNPICVMMDLILLDTVATNLPGYIKVRAAVLAELLAKPKVRVMDKFTVEALPNIQQLFPEQSEDIAKLYQPN